MATIDYNPSNVGDSDGDASQAFSNMPASVDSEIQPTPEVLSLKDQVLKLIQPWRDNVDEPPFTAGELMVIILVLHDFQPQPMETIHYEILSTFKFHGQTAWEAYVWHQRFENRTTNDPPFRVAGDWEHLTDGLYNTLKTFECPLTRTSDTDENGNEAEYTVSPNLARLYLRDHLEPTRQGVFDLMGLPAELREKIYKMILVFPKPGLTHADRPEHELRRNPRLSTLGLTSHAHKVPCSRDEMHETVRNNIAIDSLKEGLAILRVSRQVRNEALPIFYGRNVFHFGSIEHLRKASRKMTHQTLDHIQEVHLVMDGYRHRRYSTRAFRNLSLKKLILAVPIGSLFYDICCRTRHERGPPTEFQLTHLEGIPELWDVVAIAKRAKQFEIQGPGFLGGWLRERIESIEEAPQFREDDDDDY